MMVDIKFSRQICDDDSRYLEVVIRVPRIEGTHDYVCDCEGEAARVKVTRYILATASGMLRAVGASKIANAVDAVARVINKACELEVRQDVH